MTRRARLKWLALAFALPVAYTLLSTFFIVATMQSGAQDRAMVWVEGTPFQLDTMADKVRANDQFPVRGALPTSMARQQPESCRANSRPFSIGGLQAEESHAARQLLEAIAAEVGARVCLSNLFILNELPEATAGVSSGLMANVLLQSQLIPAGMVLALMFGLSPQGAGVELQPSGYSVRRNFALGLGAAAVIALALKVIALLSGTASEPPLTLAALGIGLSFAILAVEPVMQELVFRRWMIDAAGRALGMPAAAALSTLAYVFLQLPGSAIEFADNLVMGVVLAAVYAKSRSLLACIVAHVLVAAGAFSAMG